MNAVQCFDGLGLGEKLPKPYFVPSLQSYLEDLQVRSSYAGRAAKLVLEAFKLIQPWVGQDFTDCPSTWIKVLTETRVGLAPLEQALEGWAGEGAGFLYSFREDVDAILRLLNVSPTEAIDMALRDNLASDPWDGLISKTFVAEKASIRTYPATGIDYEDFLIVNLINLRLDQEEELRLVNRPHRLKSIIISARGEKIFIQKPTFYFSRMESDRMIIVLVNQQSVKTYGRQGKLHLVKIKRDHFSSREFDEFRASMAQAEFKLTQADALDTLRRSRG